MTRPGPRLDRETLRKVFHVSTGLATVGLIHRGLLGPRGLAALLLLVTGAGLLTRRVRVPLFGRILDLVERPENMKTLPAQGTILFILAELLVLLLFPRAEALFGIVVLSVGDAVSFVVGTRWGRIPHPFDRRKMIEGHLAGAAACTLGGLAYLPLLPAAVASGVAMFAEGLNWRLLGWKIDDNLSLPLIAAAAANLMLR